MSHVADIILTCSLSEENGDYNWPAINHINAYLRSQNKGELKYINSHAGGYKALQVDVFAGAFNYLNWAEFANALRSAPWEEPERVVLLVQDEHDELMRPVYLKPDSREVTYVVGDAADVLQEYLSVSDSTGTR